jgi:hypothetical protein
MLVWESAILLHGAACRDKLVTRCDSPATFFFEPHLVVSSMSMNLGLVAALLVTACGTSASSPAGSALRHASASDTSAIAAVGAARQAVGITAVHMASSVAGDGSAGGARDTFASSKDRVIIAVLSLANLPGGTKISYVRSMDGKYTNSKSATLLTTSKFFYFKFNALPGQSFTRGHYRLRLYVNDHPASEITYQVL